MDDVSQLDGIENVTPVEKTQIIKLIEDEKARRTAPLPTKCAGNEKPKPQPVPKTRKSRLVPSGLPDIKVMFTNADQLTPSKKVELTERIEREKPLIVAVSEVKPKHSNDRDLLDFEIPGYSLHPVNIDETTGRGIVVYTHKSLEKSTVQIKPEILFEEACLLEIKLRGGDTMIFGCLYRSPTYTEKSEDNNIKLNNLLKLVTRKNYSHVCILGDLNYRDINWATHTTNHSEESKEAKFIEMTVRDCFLHQHVEKHTRRRGNDEPSLIDLILTDEAMQVSSITHHAPLGKSDHDVISFKFHCYLDFAKPKQVYSYNKARFEEMKNALQGWPEQFLSGCKDKGVEESWSTFKSKMHELKEKFVPKATVSGKPSWCKKGSIPIGKPLQEAIRKKSSAHRKWKSSKKRFGCPFHAEYTATRNKVKRLMRTAKKAHEKNICLNAKENPKLFWAHVRQKLKTKAGVAPHTTSRGQRRHQLNKIRR